VKRVFPLLVLIGFLAYTGAYIFVYLFRAFRVGDRVAGEVVQVWHGDPMTRAILVSVLFLIGLVVLVGYVEIIRVAGRSGRGVRVRDDLWRWLAARSEETGEAPEHIADRAISAYRDRLEGLRR
jgi:hypothetical protein